MVREVHAYAWCHVVRDHAMGGAARGRVDGRKKELAEPSVNATEPLVVHVRLERLCVL